MYDKISVFDKNLKLSLDNFIFKILDFYAKKVKIAEESNGDVNSNNENISFCNFNELSEFINLFPSFKIIRKLLDKKLILKKELIIIKIIFEILWHYYNKFDVLSKEKLTKELIPLIKQFYSDLTKEERNYLNTKLKAKKEVVEILSIFLF